MLDIARSGRPKYPGPVVHKPGDRIAVRVVPSIVDGPDAVCRRERRGVDGAGRHRGRRASDPGLVLPSRRTSTPACRWSWAPGTWASLGPRDALTKLFAEGKVVVLKANPVNDYLVPYWSRALASLIDAGYLRIVSGGAHVGSYLVGHDLIDDIHVTGSDKTHDAIVFGVGSDGARRKAANEPLVTKPMTCELGNVSPVVIVPGEWTSAEIDYQARHVATMIANNAGFNCLTPRVIITHAGWAQREEFFTALESVFVSLPVRQRRTTPERRTDTRRSSPRTPTRTSSAPPARATLPWTIVRDVDSTDTEEICLNVEAFCALTSETALEADYAG